VTPDVVPSLPRGVRLRHDPIRDRQVLLAPERVLMPDETSAAILELCDGSTPVDEIANTLATRFDAGRDAIRKDVIELLQSLADRGYLAL
jgi:pyrroloquinoline quinone biosynthesis protein D